MIDNRAQAGSVFRLMVDAIIGLVILILILSTLSYFQSLQVSVSRAQFISIVEASIQTPNGKVITSDGTLSFVKDEAFTSSMLNGITGYPSKCFTFKGSKSFADIPEKEHAITFRQNIKTNVYGQCVVDPDVDLEYQSEECSITCIFYFGVKPSED